MLARSHQNPDGILVKWSHFLIFIRKYNIWEPKPWRVLTKISSNFREILMGFEEIWVEAPWTSCSKTLCFHSKWGKLIFLQELYRNPCEISRNRDRPIFSRNEISWKNTPCCLFRGFPSILSLNIHKCWSVDSQNDCILQYSSGKRVWWQEKPVFFLRRPSGGCYSH